MVFYSVGGSACIFKSVALASENLLEMMSLKDGDYVRIDCADGGKRHRLLPMPKFPSPLGQQ